MRILRDVAVVRTDRSELVAVSPSPGVVGEEMALDLTGGTASLHLEVCVVESRPVIVHGGVQHRIRLAISPSDNPCRDLTDAGADPKGA